MIVLSNFRLFVAFGFLLFFIKGDRCEAVLRVVHLPNLSPRPTSQ